ncbi:hypothetical protein ACFV4P_07645 [Kitasatospora sp. NPDC059795]|uniref:hypothetical protein n=1 Tax=Kitasatospora sp. NPDC059795 TaxID=3346949 RepID=UPI00365E8086
MNSSERASAYPAPPGAPGPDGFQEPFTEAPFAEVPFAEEPPPEPVFVDESGLRGRLLRGLGWPVSVVGAVLAVAMGGSLIGVQADAPAMEIPPQTARPVQPAPSASPSAEASSSPSSPSSSSSPSRTPSHSTSPRPGASTGGSKTTGKPSAPSTKHP